MESKLTTVTYALIERLRNLGLAQSYLVVPAPALAHETLFGYWHALEAADTLKYRWSDIESPTAGAIVDHVKNSVHCYNVVDVSNGLVLADFSLGPFTGRAAQIHFSMLPGQPTALSAFLADKVSDMILLHWKDVVGLEESFVETLFGITPTKNRVACIFIRKAGFKTMGTLVSGTKYLNEVCDGLLTTKSRKA